MFTCRYEKHHPVWKTYIERLVDDKWELEIKEDRYCDCEFREKTLF